MTKTRTEKYCSACHKKKRIKDDFYLASNSVINTDGRLSICKTCLEPVANIQDVNEFINVMRMIDRPFLKSEYDASLTASNSFGEYMRRLAMPQNRNKNYLDSEFNKELSEHSNKEELQEFTDGISIEGKGFTADSLVALRKKWGKFEEDDYEFLEEFYRDYANTYSTDTPAQVNLYRNIAKVHLQAEKELPKGNIKAYKDLMDLSSKMHKDGNISPIQNTGANDDRGLSTYGLWIREIEKEEPCEYFENRKMYEDYDSFKTYWQKWFIRPFKNIFNISKDFDVGDDK